ncbi:uncharacterized protein LOC124275122 isoform X2 [Haliotis rubra]|uniref:uncharacterized protein LOC124275122 isoform X2 n=1 Tax=Haliotis rubra TaxID=36100 RepID=UPI001EE5E2E0|nr:uncharacterized protein LOC124275122 isoform X2 [Haliotis rubra]
MEDHLELPGRTIDSDSSDDSSVPSRYSSEGDIPLPTFDDLSGPDDPAPGFKTSGDMYRPSIVSATEQREIQRILSVESTQSFFGIFPAHIDATLNTYHGHIVQRLRDLPDRDCTVIIAGGSLLKMIDPSWEGRVPSSVLCDVCVFSPTQPVMVLTFTGKDGNNKTITKYNTNLATLIIKHVKKDTNLDFNLIHVTVDNLVSQEKHSFLTKINKRENSTKSIYFPTELHMGKDKCTTVMTSFLKHLSKDTESDRLSPSLEDTAHAPAIPKQDAAGELQQQIHTREAGDEAIYLRHEMQTTLLKYLSAQQEKLEDESSPQFLNTSQDKPSELQHLEADARTSSTSITTPVCSQAY